MGRGFSRPLVQLLGFHPCPRFIRARLGVPIEKPSSGFLNQLTHSPQEQPRNWAPTDAPETKERGALTSNDLAFVFLPFQGVVHKCEERSCPARPETIAHNAILSSPTNLSQQTSFRIISPISIYKQPSE